MQRYSRVLTLDNVAQQAGVLPEAASHSCPQHLSKGGLHHDLIDLKERGVLAFDGCAAQAPAAPLCRTESHPPGSDPASHDLAIMHVWTQNTLT
jgi:hypothetical protein